MKFKFSKTTSSIFIILLLGLFTSTHALALSRDNNSLNLSEEQITKIKTDKEKTRKKAVKLRAEKQILQIDLDEEVEKDKPDMKKIEKLIQEISGLDNKIQLDHIKHKIFFRSLLTSEQKNKLNSKEIERFNGCNYHYCY